MRQQKLRRAPAIVSGLIDATAALKQETANQRPRMMQSARRRPSVRAAENGGVAEGVTYPRQFAGDKIERPVDVDLVFESGARERRHWNGAEATTRIFYKGSDPLRFAIVDPDDRILLDENRANNRIGIGREASVVQIVPAAPRTLERLAYWASVILQSLGP